LFNSQKPQRMKKIILFTIVCFLGAVSVQADASMYRLDHASVDQMFDQAEQADFLAMNTLAPYANSSTATHSFYSADKNPAVAFILAWFVGYLGIHRAYLGTSTGTIVAYILTLGGCGIVAFVDWVVLLIGLVNDDIGKYIDNPKFFMW
jgi:TM2 domain-containing membrane protein YozV